MSSEIVIRIKWALQPAQRQARTAFRKGPAAFMQNRLPEIYEAIASNISSAAPGSRCWPNKKFDSQAGIRLDWGTFTSDGLYRMLDIQINTNTDNATLKALAAGDGSHKKRAILYLPVKGDGNLLESASAALEDFYRKNVITLGSENGI